MKSPIHICDLCAQPGCEIYKPQENVCAHFLVLEIECGKCDRCKYLLYTPPWGDYGRGEWQCHFSLWPESEDMPVNCRKFEERKLGVDE